MYSNSTVIIGKYVRALLTNEAKLLLATNTCTYSIVVKIVWLCCVPVMFSIRKLHAGYS